MTDSDIPGNPRKDFDHPSHLLFSQHKHSDLFPSGLDRFFWNETIARAGTLKKLEQWVSFKFSSNSLLLDIFCEIIMKQKDKITLKQQQASQRVTTSTTMHCAREQE